MFFMIPAGDWSTSLAAKGRSKFCGNVNQIITSAWEESRPRREHELGYSYKLSIAYM
jgi:hypothetical protein